MPMKKLRVGLIGLGSVSEVHLEGFKDADYVDIVQVALLQTLGDESHPLKGADLSQVSAFKRLGMSTDVEEIDLSGGVIEVEEIKVAIR